MKVTMDGINNVKPVNDVVNPANINVDNNKGDTKEAQNLANQLDEGVKYEPGVEEKVTYDKADIKQSPEVREKFIASLKAQADQNYQTLKMMVRQMLEEQGLTFKDTFMGEDVSSYKVDAATQAKAKELIADDGPLGVDAVATRIVDFAKAISGGDPEMVEKMRGAIQKGFDEAAELFGGELPEISQKTYDEIMTRLDKWAGAGKEAQPEVAGAKVE